MPRGYRGTGIPGDHIGDFRLLLERQIARGAVSRRLRRGRGDWQRQQEHAGEESSQNRSPAAGLERMSFERAGDKNSSVNAGNPAPGLPPQGRAREG